MVNENGEKDYYKFTMSLKMIRKPGERVAYCTGGAHLAGGVLQRAARQSLPDLMDKFLGQPLDVSTYYLGAYAYR